MTKFLESVHGFVWGMPALVLILGVGIYLTVRTGFVQIRLFSEALKQFFRLLVQRKDSKQGVSGFQALCTALAATVGTGNLVGVAGAICIGGPGSIFWMWFCGFLGMAVKFAEVTLAVRYRVNQGGESLGGPMYMISRGMGRKYTFLAYAYSFFGVVAALGVGNATQINAVISGINGVLTSFGGRETLLGNMLLGLGLAVLIGAMLLGGARRIGAVAEGLIPLVSSLYILLCVGVLILRAEQIPAAVSSIIHGAFNPLAVTGGILGSAFQALKVGCSRGVFTNEAGMGTASIAHAAADVKHPAEQGMMGIMEVFLDTIVICTLTALAILCSGVDIPYGVDVGASLTGDAFSAVYGEWVMVFLAAALCCFAFATVLGWGLYGARCAQFLFGQRAWKWFSLVQVAAVLPGALMKTGIVWLAAEAINGLMAIPNLIALAVLTPEVVRLTKEFIGRLRP